MVTQHNRYEGNNDGEPFLNSIFDRYNANQFEFNIQDEGKLLGV